MTLKQAVEGFVARASARGFHGRTLSVAEIQSLDIALAGAYPTWLAELLSAVPLCDLQLGWREYGPDASFYGVEWLNWCGAAGVISESVNCYPGCAILSAGFINVASCSGGSGNPYFISVNEGDDPPLYRVLHDVSDRTDIILAEGRETVAPHLSEFFRGALVQGT